MSHEVTLPSGATAVLREADELLAGDRDDALAMMNPDLDGEKLRSPMGEVLVQYQHAVIMLGVESWTCTDRAGEPLPVPAVDKTSLRKITARDSAFLYNELEPLKNELFPDFTVGPTGSPTTP